MGRALSELSATDLAVWQAWYEIEPRGEERWDYLIAFLASLQIANEEVGLGEVLEGIRDMWSPMTEAKRQARKTKRKKRWKQRLKPMADAARMLDQQRKAKANGQHEHRQVVGNGNA